MLPQARSIEELGSGLRSVIDLVRPVNPHPHLRDNSSGSAHWPTGTFADAFSTSCRAISKSIRTSSVKVFSLRTENRMR
jgi:hypothetical protein